MSVVGPAGMRPNVVARLHGAIAQVIDGPETRKRMLDAGLEVQRLLKTMEQLAPAATWRSKRIRIEHGDGVGAETMVQASRFGVVVIQNPTHLPPAEKAGALTITNQRLRLKSLLVAGIPLALGSDGGPPEQNPFLNLMLASVYGGDSTEALTREEALTAYTAGGAYAEGQEGRKGRIMVGLDADLAVLSQDVLKVPASQLPGTTSVLTLVNGEVIFEDASGQERLR